MRSCFYLCEAQLEFLELFCCLSSLWFKYLLEFLDIFLGGRGAEYMSVRVNSHFCDLFSLQSFLFIAVFPLCVGLNCNNVKTVSSERESCTYSVCLCFKKAFSAAQFLKKIN